MVLIDSHELPFLDTGSNRYNPYDTLEHFVFDEASDPAMAEEAWVIHALSYSSYKFIDEGALVPGPITGRDVVRHDIDKARGPNVAYYMGMNPNLVNDVATLRLIDIKNKGSIEDLPAFNLCKDVLSFSGRDLLNNHDPEKIREIAAFGRHPESRPDSLYEVLRTAVHDSLGKDELWYFSIVSLTRKALVRELGVSNLEIIGDDISLEDESVRPGLRLQPTVLRPDNFLDNLLVEGGLAQPGSNASHRLAKRLVFFSEGLKESQMSECVSKEVGRITENNNMENAQ